MSTNFTTFLATHQWIIILIVLWTIPWKGVALWKAARNQSTVWFVILLIVNTLGILEIIYIFFFSKKKFSPEHLEASEIKNVERRVLDIKRD